MAITGPSMITTVTAGHTHESWAHPGRFREREPSRRRDYAPARLHRRNRRAGGQRQDGARPGALRRPSRPSEPRGRHQRHLHPRGRRVPSQSSALAAERIRAVETGGCPHAAIREDIGHHLDALEQLDGGRVALSSCFIESGGDNLAAQFSRELVDYTIYVIDVAGGDKVPRKGRPRNHAIGLLVINKTDLAPHVGASLEVMARDARAMRGRRSIRILASEPGRRARSDCQRDPRRVAAGRRGRGRSGHPEDLRLSALSPQREIHPPDNSRKQPKGEIAFRGVTQVMRKWLIALVACCQLASEGCSKDETAPGTGRFFVFGGRDSPPRRRPLRPLRVATRSRWESCIPCPERWRSARRPPRRGAHDDRRDQREGRRAREKARTGRGRSASNWPLFAEKARELLQKDGVAAVFGCWTSVSRKSVLPVFEELNGLLFYPSSTRARSRRTTSFTRARRPISRRSLRSST